MRELPAIDTLVEEFDNAVNMLFRLAQLYDVGEVAALLLVADVHVNVVYGNRYAIPLIFTIDIENWLHMFMIGGYSNEADGV